MNNEIVAVSDPIPDPMSIHQRILRGRAIALLYIAAQHLSQAASDDACRLLEEANDRWQNYGFNQQMRRSPYGTRAVGSSTHEWFTAKETEAQRADRIRRMTTEPWMLPPAEQSFEVIMPWDQPSHNTLPI